MSGSKLGAPSGCIVCGQWATLKAGRGGRARRPEIDFKQVHHYLYILFFTVAKICSLELGLRCRITDFFLVSGLRISGLAGTGSGQIFGIRPHRISGKITIKLLTSFIQSNPKTDEDLLLKSEYLSWSATSDLLLVEICPSPIEDSTTLPLLSIQFARNYTANLSYPSTMFIV